MIPSRAVRWPWFTLLLILLAAPSAAAVDLDEAAMLEPEALAERLGIVGTPEAVVLVVADQDLDRLIIGLREVVLAPLKDGTRFLRLVRGQVDGILPLRVERGDLLWEGDLRTLAGTVTVFDAGAALASPEARGLARDRALRGFDLFAFFAELDALPGVDERRAHCDAARQSMPPGPDRGLVVQACANVATMVVPPRMEAVASPDSSEDDEGDEDEEDDAEASVPAQALAPAPAARNPVLHRRDGITRRIPRGTWPRLGALAGGFVLAGGMTGRAFELEMSAERSYARARDAEQVGDDFLVSQYLFDTKKFDAHRDAAIATASAGLITSVAMMIWQGIEQRLFARAKGASGATVAIVPLEGGAALAFSLELDR